MDERRRVEAECWRGRGEPLRRQARFRYSRARRCRGAGRHAAFGFQALVFRAAAYYAARRFRSMTRARSPQRAWPRSAVPRSAVPRSAVPRFASTGRRPPAVARPAPCARRALRAGLLAHAPQVARLAQPAHGINHRVEHPEEEKAQVLTGVELPQPVRLAQPGRHPFRAAASRAWKRPSHFQPRRSRSWIFFLPRVHRAAIGARICPYSSLRPSESCVTVRDRSCVTRFLRT